MDTTFSITFPCPMYFNRGIFLSVWAGFVSGFFFILLSPLFFSVFCAKASENKIRINKLVGRVQL